MLCDVPIYIPSGYNQFEIWFYASFMNFQTQQMDFWSRL